MGRLLNPWVCIVQRFRFSTGRFKSFKKPDGTLAALLDDNKYFGYPPKNRPLSKKYHQYGKQMTLV